MEGHIKSCLIGLLLVGNAANAQTELRIDSQLANDPNSIDISVKLEGDTSQLQGLTFDVRYALFGRGPLTYNGPAANAGSNRNVYYSQYRPGVLTVVVMPGENATNLQPGTLTVLNFSLNETASGYLSIPYARPSGYTTTPSLANTSAFIVHPALASVDTDKDGVDDGTEIAQGTNPLSKDTAPSFVSRPRLTPEGGTFREDVVVSMATDTTVAQIWYASGGHNPAPNAMGSVRYTGPIRVSRNETLKAIAAVTTPTGEIITSDVSAPAVFSFDLTPIAPAPSVIPSIGTVPIENISIALDDPEATVYYTLDGTTPSATNGTPYAEPISLASSAVIKAIAIKPGHSDSEVITATFGEPANSVLEKLTVSSNGNHLVTQSGAPFFWMADTAWYLDRVSPEDIKVYFADRAARGFNVIQGPIIIGTRPDDEANPTVELLAEKFNPFSYDPARYEGCAESGPWYPLTGAVVSPTTPSPGTWNECYLRYLDFIIDEASINGLYIALPVIWGPSADLVFPYPVEGSESESLAYKMSQDLAARYADRSNIIWIATGEYHKIFRALPWDKTIRVASVTLETAQKDFPRELRLLTSIAQGLNAGHGGQTLTTTHPTGGVSSSGFFHDAPWLDFNMIQSGQVDASDANDVINDRLLLPRKPTINAEPAYEGDEVTPYIARYMAYQSLMQGAFGHAYGHASVWNFDPNWAEFLGASGATQMGYAKKLFESRPLTSRTPLTARFVIGNSDANIEFEQMQRVVASGDENGRYAFVYFPNGTSVRTIDVSQLAGPSINAWWFNPRDGKTYASDGVSLTDAPFANFATTTSPVTIDPPGDSAIDDWVLVLDSSAIAFEVPGTQIDSDNLAAEVVIGDVLNTVVTVNSPL